jgi:hypothetical protein
MSDLVPGMADKSARNPYDEPAQRFIASAVLIAD